MNEANVTLSRCRQLREGTVFETDAGVHQTENLERFIEIVFNMKCLRDFNYRSSMTVFNTPPGLQCRTVFSASIRPVMQSQLR